MRASFSNCRPTSARRAGLKKYAAHSLVAWITLPGWLWSASGADHPPDSLEFFEKRIRPVLSEQCYRCHSEKAEKLKGGLHLDSREDLLKGGDTGPAIVPGDVENSLLITTVRWKDKDLAMPPKKPLPPDQLADLEAWVKAGAPWPKNDGPKSAKKESFNIQKRKVEHWCWASPSAHSVPTVNAAQWRQSPIDPFILSKLQAQGLKPANEADRPTLIRRATFDITGLPPTPAEVDAFVADKSPDAFSRVIDRLLGSPHFGERWGRHWLDLVRFAETRGHEFDPAIPNAWQYRDYVIRALNADIPYNQFAMEHIAGDLIPPRIDPRSGANESILGTGFWMLGEEVHSPVEIRQDEVERMDNRLDVMGKTFLGLTISCARCHDHKFDAISHKDYYALSGFLISSGYRQARFETLESHTQLGRELETLRNSSRPALLKATHRALKPGLGRMSKNLLAAADSLHGTPADTAAHTHQTELADTQRWIAELGAANKDQKHPLFLFAKLASEKGMDTPDKFSARLKALLRPATAVALRPPLPAESVVIDYAKLDTRHWLQDGVSFGSQPVPVGAPLFETAGNSAFLGINTRAAAVRDRFWKSLAIKNSQRDTGKLGQWDRSEQTLRTPDFNLKSKGLWYLVKGSGRAYAAVNSHLIIQGPLHGRLLFEWKAKEPGWHWQHHALETYHGHRLHVEFSPIPNEDLSIAMVVQADESPAAPPSFNPLLLKALENQTSLAGAATALEKLFGDVADQVGSDALAEAPSATDRAEIADWILRNAPVLVPAGSPQAQELAGAEAEFIRKQKALSGRIRSDSQTAPAAFDGSGVDEFLLVRGQSKSPGAQIPRRFLEAIAGPEPMKIKSGSGRRELAQEITAATNPLFARVMVNRVWHHLFGKGIVPTVDNFGVLGQKPSHPELLDFLALRFAGEHRWSLKTLIRELMLSRAYQMSSQPSDFAAEQADPENLLLHRMNVRRLEGEAIRDAVLAVSGRFNPKVGGPSVPVHLTSFMEGRGAPKEKGPLDGDGRRSIYTIVRRNFLPPMMLAFDTPIPFNTMGRRNISNVPAQALILMNDPFIVEQAGVWAKKHAGLADPRARISALYRDAFGRPPAAEEVVSAEEFLRTQAQLYQTEDPQNQKLWADLCHVLLNTKEFIYLN
jgi:hypothetical protein